jgi:hypothetical protein
MNRPLAGAEIPVSLLFADIRLPPSATGSGALRD